MLLYSLPPSFENFRCAIESRDELPTPEVLRVKIVEESDARKNDTRISDNNAMLARKQNGKRYDNSKKNKSGGNEQKDKEPFKYKCHRCHQVGHKAKDCESAKKQPENARKAENLSMYAFSENSHEEALKSTDASRSETWCLDSGCTSHLCKDNERFVEVVESRPGIINLASNASRCTIGLSSL
jgi:gag-polypeptide of LTR copia-type